MKIQSLNSVQRYYHASNDSNLGEEMEPRGYYEAVDEYGDLVLHQYSDANELPIHMLSDTAESSFSKTKEGAVLAKIQSNLYENGSYNLSVAVGTYYLYETSEEPEVDLSNASMGDFAMFEEVRYRRPITIEKVPGSFYVPLELLKDLNIQEAYELELSREGWDILKRAKSIIRMRLK